MAKAHWTEQAQEDDSMGQQQSGHIGHNANTVSWSQ